MLIKMGSHNIINHNFANVSLNSKITALESAIQQCFVNFKDILPEIECIQTESANCRTKLLTQQEKCASKICSGSEALKKVIETKDNIINLAASTATRLNETKNLSILNDIFKILCGETVTLTPRDKQEKIKDDNTSPPKSTATPIKKKLSCMKKEIDTSLEDVSFKDESISEIEGTPGRTSPIIHGKKLKSSSVTSFSGTSAELREKKKCSDSWPTPEAKQLKLTYTSKGSGRSRQMRLNFVPTKPTSVVDLTCSPDVPKEPSSCQSSHVQKLIKKESSDSGDTILPSPTSGPSNFLLSNTASKETKNRKPLSLSRAKLEPDEACSPIIQFVVDKSKGNSKIDFEESINILQPNRFKSPRKNSPRKQSKVKQSPFKMKRATIKSEPPPVKMDQSPVKMDQSPVKMEQSPVKIDKSPIKMDQSPIKTKLQTIKMENLTQQHLDEDLTHCEESSMSILQHLNKLEDKKPEFIGQLSPSKRPLAENKNVTNIPTSTSNHESSMSLLQPECVRPIQDNVKRKLLENVEPIYKEPTVRKKAEKAALPGWFCDECKAFFGDLYADDPEKIKVAIDRCSKHRGRNNPVRPKTPPGFWNPRWDVPENTEEFNRRNNAN